MYAADLMVVVLNGVPTECGREFVYSNKSGICDLRIQQLPMPTSRRPEIVYSRYPPKRSPHLRRDRITKQDTPTRQSLKRVSLTLLAPSHRLKAARNVQRVAGLGSDQTCADRFFIRKFTSVAYELATEAFSPVGGVDDKQIQ
jgi:hypothetical protein